MWKRLIAFLVGCFVCVTAFYVGRASKQCDHPPTVIHDDDTHVPFGAWVTPPSQQQLADQAGDYFGAMNDELERTSDEE